MTPQASIFRLPNGTCELKMEGHFSHPHWTAFLFSGLFAARVSVVSGRAIQNGSLWSAQLILDFSKSLSPPESLNYVSFALQKPATTDSTVPKISKHKILRRGDQSLEVWLDGPDQIGFLGRVLGRMSLLMLFPTEIEINTVSGQIRDRFVLRGIGGLAPNDDAQHSLDTLLKACKVA